MQTFKPESFISLAVMPQWTVQTCKQHSQRLKWFSSRLNLLGTETNTISSDLKVMCPPSKKSNDAAADCGVCFINYLYTITAMLHPPRLVGLIRDLNNYLIPYTIHNHCYAPPSLPGW